MKAARQRKIQEIIEHENIETQGELTEKLKELGFSVTQATVSRDIKELGFLKVPTGLNSGKYSIHRQAPNLHILERTRRLFRDSITDMDFSENIIVLHTLPGAAQAIGSCVDHLDWQEIIGSVAGDDTVIVVIKPQDQVGAILKKLQALLD
ncbi:arginine repressor [Dehalobacterium formicoaceticum]|uniref:Arginine repressor n=1 Tax=Dehalobacterium formicoaceticum TaxID=51515 RepID=A0ABT1Y4K2_9FIRM|nr:arginine repressor [Dehalobacterium formicoaceticum]MCR6545804.1 arginine repressor [Dehalobacterium formicoaceticum]